MRPKKSAAHIWLQLLRAPNLFTVPGDPLAGYLLVSGGPIDAGVACAMLASLAIYAHGLLLNDLADLDEDRRERPGRPLPSGATKLATVRAIAIGLAALALLFCIVAGPLTFLVGLALLAVVAFYNLWAKPIAVLGPVSMGLCRGLSLLLGASAALAAGGPAALLPPLAFFTAACLTLYIALVTHLARIETLPDPPHLPRGLPFLGLLIGVVPTFLLALDRAQPLSAFNLALYAVSAYTLYAGFKIHRALTRQPSPPIPPMIGRLIRLLLPLQALWCLASRNLAGGVAAAALLLLWPISRSVSRRFYAS